MGVRYQVRAMSGIDTASNRRRLQPGERVGDHLVVRKVLGQGGTAVVYEALHTRLGAAVALKVLDVPESYLADGVLRMQREAEVCASIEDPHVPRIYDINTLPDGTPYVVMEKVSGSTLEELLAQGPLALETVLEIADDLLAALSAVHRVGVIHRDIKPANLILQRESDGAYRVRLMDFGVSKATFREPTDPKLTRVGTVVGTPHYMAPEQITGEAVDARADVYATGVVLFEMLSGRMPFEGESTAEVVAAVLRHTPLPLASLRPEVSPQLESVVMRAMAPRAGDRFLTVRDMRAALAQCKTAERVSALSLVPAPRGFPLVPEQASTPRFRPLASSSAARRLLQPSGRAATRRYSMLGAGLAVLVGTMGFPRATKHVSGSEVTPAQVVARAEDSRPGVPPPLPVPEAMPPHEPRWIGEAPRFRLEMPGQLREIAASPESEGGAQTVGEPELFPEEAPSGAQFGEREQAQTRERAREAAAERRALRDEQERIARRRLREAEARMARDEAPNPGVLISDYVKQLEAIQREALEQSTELPDATKTPAESAPFNDLLPPNPYPN